MSAQKSYTINSVYTTTSGTHPIASIFANGKNYIFYFTSSDTISYLRGDDGVTHSDTSIVLSNATVSVTVKKSLLAATAYQDKDGNPTSIRVYYTDSSQLIHELIGDFESGSTETINWKIGGLTDCKYKVSTGSGLAASSSKNGTLRVFFMPSSDSSKISNAYFHDSDGKWNVKTLL